MVQALRTSCNLIEPRQHRPSKVCRVLWQEVGRVQALDVVLEFCNRSSGWFDCTQPSLATWLQGKQGVQGASALVWGGSVLLWFEKFRGGSLRLNYPERVQKHPAHLVSPVTK